MANGRSLPLAIGAAVGVIVACAALFAFVGAIRDDGGPAIDAADPGTATATASDTDAPADTGDGAASEPESSSTAPAEGESAPAEDASSPAEEEPAPSEEEPSETDTEPAESGDEPNGDVDPAAVSIQVLDAVGTDGGAAAQEVRDELEAAGFDVIVINGSRRTYEATTVFWSEGQGPAGRAVADALSASEAERTPEEVSLSESVDVHVVVGLDRA